MMTNGNHAQLALAQVLVVLCVTLNVAAAPAAAPDGSSSVSLSVRVVQRTETNVLLVAELRNETGKELRIEGQTAFSWRYRAWDADTSLPVSSGGMCARVLDQPLFERLITVAPGHIVSNLFPIALPTRSATHLEARAIYSTNVRMKDIKDSPSWMGALTSAWIRVTSTDVGDKP
jgi:hypothetical protein